MKSLYDFRCPACNATSVVHGRRQTVTCFACRRVYVTNDLLHTRFEVLRPVGGASWKIWLALCGMTMYQVNLTRACASAFIAFFHDDWLDSYRVNRGIVGAIRIKLGYELGQYPEEGVVRVLFDARQHEVFLQCVRLLRDSFSEWDHA